MILGDMNGRLAIYSFTSEAEIYNEQVFKENIIVNYLKLYDSRTGGTKLAAGTNEQSLKIFSLESKMKLEVEYKFEECVNHFAISPC